MLNLHASSEFRLLRIGNMSIINMAANSVRALTLCTGC